MNEVCDCNIQGLGLLHLILMTFKVSISGICDNNATQDSSCKYQVFYLET